MWQAYECPFGCGEKHMETLSSEAMAYFYGGHRKVCPKLASDNEGES